MLAEFGQIALILAVILCPIQAWYGLSGAYFGKTSEMALAERCAQLQALLCVIAFAILLIVFAQSDFSVLLVANHSHTTKPFLYKISGAWGNHEGSMLLWVMITAVFGACIVWFGQSLPATLRARAVAVQGLVGLGFGAFLTLTSNPFERLAPVPMNGLGLNPLLQDVGLALHPPFLYLGYVGFSVAFSLAVAALIEGRVDALWARWVRPWVLMSWSFLTIGIMLGSVWAYYELGWGGWWFWDPVENVSFMPWLAGTALLHCTLVAQARGSFLRWTLLLAITTFSLSLVGTFIVRSGLLTSVHAFAVDPERGVFILALLIIATGGALILYAVRAGSIKDGAGFTLQSKDSALMMNNILLVTATATVFLGTFYPLIIDALTGNKITVGPPYFELTFAPIMSVLILIMAVGPLLKWREDSLSRLKGPLLIIALLTLGVAALVFMFGKSVFGVLGLGLATWLAAGTIIQYGRKLRLGAEKSNTGNLFKRFAMQSGATHGFALAHLGIAVTTAGIAAMGVWSVETADRLKPGEAIELAGYTYTLDSVRERDGANFIAETARVSVRNASTTAILEPERRFYPVEQNMTTEGSMDVSALRILYAAIGEGDPQAGWIVRVYYHPLVVWIWFGTVMMALGGLVSLVDRQHGFVRTPKRLDKSNAPVVPAE